MQASPRPALPRPGRASTSWCRARACRPARYRARARRVWGDIELAYRALAVPIVAVTGTNGKSTTVRLLEAMLRAAGLRARAGGNVGDAALGLVGEPLDVAVLEVSSFQLETIESFRPRVALLLNLTPDHLDRHGDLAGYLAAKARIFENQAAGRRRDRERRPGARRARGRPPRARAALRRARHGGARRVLGRRRRVPPDGRAPRCASRSKGCRGRAARCARTCSRRSSPWWRSAPSRGRRSRRSRTSRPCPTAPSWWPSAPACAG